MLMPEGQHAKLNYEDIVLDRIRIVLVEPSHPGNIGGAARAMKTMGMQRLVLVNPGRYPDPQADWRAAGAMDVLDSATVVDDLAAALEGCRFVVGTSTRMRSIPWPVISAKELGGVLAEQPGETDIAILFGREDSGLSNEELQSCHVHMQIPSSDIYGSLNLAMAVQVVCYEIFQHQLQAPDGAASNSVKDLAKEGERLEASALGTRIWDKDPATVEQFDALMVHWEQALVASGFIKAGNPGHTLTRLRRMFMRHQLDETEVQIMRGALKHFAVGVAQQSDDRSGN
jgi:tRNA (cytidine32/uridine32-2'-O)-methyltransferase